MSEFAPDELGQTPETELDRICDALERAGQVRRSIHVLDPGEEVEQPSYKLNPVDAMIEITKEFDRARKLLPRPFINAHEAHSIIREEFTEFETEVYVNHQNRNPAKMRNELIQLAAMCLRALVEVDAHDP